MRTSPISNAHGTHLRRARCVGRVGSALLLTLTGCSSSEPVSPPTDAAPEVAAPAPAAAPSTSAKERGKGTKAARQAAREAKREQRLQERKTSFDKQAETFEYPVVARTTEATVLRAKIKETVEPLVGKPLRWTLRSCASETLWDSAEGTLKAQGATLVTASSLDSTSCASGGRSRSVVEFAHVTSVEADARSTHQQLVALVGAEGHTKLQVQKTTHTPDQPAAFAVVATERLRKEAAAPDLTSGLSKSVGERFWSTGAPALQPVCGKANIVREWVLEEVAAMPEKASAAPKQTKNGKTRPPRERHRSWASLTIRSAEAASGVVHASIFTRDPTRAAAKEAQNSPSPVSSSLHQALKSAGMIDSSPLTDAQYRCGG